MEIQVVCFSQLLVYFHFVATRPSVKSVLEYTVCSMGWSPPGTSLFKSPPRDFPCKKGMSCLHTFGNDCFVCERCKDNGRRYAHYENLMQLGLPTHCGAVVCNWSCLEIRMFMCLHRLSSQKVFKSAGARAISHWRLLSWAWWESFLHQECPISILIELHFNATETCCKQKCGSLLHACYLWLIFSYHI